MSVTLEPVINFAPVMCFERVVVSESLHAGGVSKTERRVYASDVSDEEWAFVAPIWPYAGKMPPGGIIHCGRFSTIFVTL